MDDTAPETADLQCRRDALFDRIAAEVARVLSADEVSVLLWPRLFDRYDAVGLADVLECGATKDQALDWHFAHLQIRQLDRRIVRAGRGT